MPFLGDSGCPDTRFNRCPTGLGPWKSALILPNIGSADAEGGQWQGVALYGPALPAEQPERGASRHRSDMFDPMTREGVDLALPVSGSPRTATSRTGIVLRVFALLFAALTLHACSTLENGEEGDIKSALEKLQPLAEEGDLTAQNKLAIMYEKGQDVEQDYAKAAEWYRKAAEQGDVAAQSKLGLLYSEGQGVAKDLKTAAGWWLKAAEQGLPVAQYRMGVAYAKGAGVKQDYAKASSWWHKGAEQGHAPAKFNLGVTYLKGWSVPQDYVFAHMWFNLAAAQSYSNADKLRNQLAAKMTIEQVAEAQKLARDWTTKFGAKKEKK